MNDLMGSNEKIMMQKPIESLKPEKKYEFAIDYTNDPYYGNIDISNEKYVIRGQSKKSTNSFYSYISLYIINDKERFTISVLPVEKGKSKYGSYGLITNNTISKGNRQLSMNNIVNNLTIFLIAYIVFFAGCVEKETTISTETPTITSNITLNKTYIEYLKKDCIAAAICGIDLEIVNHQKWIDMHKKGEVDGEDLPEIGGRLNRLKADLEKYQKMKLDHYVIPEKRVEIAWISANEPLGDNSILYVENMSMSGPWYHLVGIRGNNYSVIQPDTKYLMNIYLVYPRYYWTMPSYYVYVFDINNI